MKIEWHEDLCGGTSERPAWTVRALAGDVVVELRHNVTINSTSRRLENLRMEALDGVRAGLGLPQDAIEEGDITGVAAAMGALRGMAQEALLLEMEQHDARLMGLTLEFATARHAAQEEEPDTIEAVIGEWEAAGNIASRYPNGHMVYFETTEARATWDTRPDDERPLRVAGGKWVPGTLADLRRALGLEVKP